MAASATIHQRPNLGTLPLLALPGEELGLEEADHVFNSVGGRAGDELDREKNEGGMKMI